MCVTVLQYIFIYIMFACVRAYLKNGTAKSSAKLLVSLGVVQRKFAFGFLSKV